MAESAKAPRNPPCMMPAGLANRSSAVMRQVQCPGEAFSRHTIPSVRSLLGGTCIGVRIGEHQVTMAHDP